MARASVTAENQALDALTGGTVNVAAYIGLNTGDTSTSGANEVSGGGYARQACTWNAASGGAKTNSSALSFTTGGVTANTYFSTWSASSAGTFGIGGALASSVTAVTVTVAAGALSLGAS